MRDMRIGADGFENMVPMGGLMTDEEARDAFALEHEAEAAKADELAQRVLRIVKDDIETGRRANENERDTRVRDYNIYRARGDGRQERPGRSRIKSSDTMDAIEWMMPSFMKTFAGANSCVSVSPIGTEDVEKAEKMQRLLNWQFMGRRVGGFRVLYEWIKAALIYGTSVVKVTWRDIYVTKGFDVPIASEAEIARMMGDDDYIDVNATPEEIPAGAAITEETMRLAQSDPNMLAKIGNINAAPQQIQPIALEPMRVYRDVRGTKRIKSYSGPMVEVISPEDFWMDPDATSVENAQFVIHRVHRTFGELKDMERDGVYKNVDKVKEWADKSKDYLANAESSERYAAAGRIDPATNSSPNQDLQPARRKLEVFEWWGLLDLKNDGFQEPYMVVVCGDSILRMEKNPYGHGQAPFEVLRPMLDPFTFLGIGMPELVGEFQELKTALLRQTLDNVSFQNNGMWLVNRNAGVDINALLNPRPGTIVRANITQGAVTPITPSSLQSMPLTMLELVDSMLQKRTGVTSYNQGIDANSLNKMLALDTPIPMADGTTKLNKDVVAGDYVIGSDGKPTEVLEAHPVQLPERAFALTFESGETIRAGGEHLWICSVRKGRKPFGAMETLPTQRIFELVRSGHKVIIPRVKAVEYPEKELTLDPYVLGAWLGDGHSHTTRITCADDYIVERIRKWAQQFYKGDLAATSFQNSGRAITYNVVNTPLRLMLLDLGVLRDNRYNDNEKHIPEEYLTASKEQRLELLRGLMDTDGHRYTYGAPDKPSGRAVFCTSSERLKDDVMRLIASLGGIPVVHSQVPKYGDRKYKRHYHISFSMPDCPFALPRKAKLWNPNGSITKQRLISIEEIPVEPMRCLSVAAEDRMYCCGKLYTLTRNTATGITKIMNASAQRIELIARIMAETGIRPLYQKMLMLNQQFIDQTIVIRIFNRPVEISPDDLAGDFDVIVDVGGATGRDETRTQQMMMLIQYAANLMQLGVMRPMNIYEVCKQLMELWGWKDYDRYISNPQENEKLQQAMQIIEQLGAMVQQGQAPQPQVIVQAFQQIYSLINEVLGASARQNMPIQGTPANEAVQGAGGGADSGEYAATTIPGRTLNGASSV